MNRLESSIMEMRHHFIYGRDTDERTEMMKEIVRNNPIVIDENKTMGIYLDVIGIPRVSGNFSDLDKSKLDLFAHEYLGFVLWDELLNRFREAIDLEKEKERIDLFLKRMSKLDGYYAKTIEEYAREIKSSRDAFLEAYMQYVQTGEIIPFTEKLNVPFIMIEYAIRMFKEMLNNSSFFAVIADNKEDISIYSQRAINNLVCSRINGDISMNVVTDPDKWRTFYSQNDQLAEYIHDYGVIELDNSLKEQVKRLRLKYTSEEE